MRYDGHFATRAAPELAWTTGVQRPAAEQIADRKCALDCFDIRHAADWIRNLAADIHAVGKAAGTTGPSKGFGQDTDGIATSLVGTELENRKVVGVPNRRGLFAILFRC